jgi:hypothetical protein
MIRSVQEITHLFRFALRLVGGTSFCFCTEATDMREHVLLFCLLGLVLIATIILVIAPGAVTWALALIA